MQVEQFERYDVINTLKYTLEHLHYFFFLRLCKISFVFSCILKKLNNMLKFLGAYSGLHERMLLEDLLAYYNKLERPVANESEAVVLTFGLTLQQIIDVVSHQAFKKDL